MSPEDNPQKPDSAGVSPEEKPRRPRGFAAMPPEVVRELARKGGKAAHAAGTAHAFTAEEARIAGRKGGLARAQRAARVLTVAESTETIDKTVVAATPEAKS